MSMHDKELPFGGNRCFVYRSKLIPGREFKGDWRSAPEELIVYNARIKIVCASYKVCPKHLHPKLKMENRWFFGEMTPVEVVNDLWGDLPPEPIEPRQLSVGNNWDPRYKNFLPVLRSSLHPLFRNARTSLIVDHVRTLQFMLLCEAYPQTGNPQTDISWESHQAYAYQYPVELYDDVDENGENDRIKQLARDYAELTKQEKRDRDKFQSLLLGQILEKRSKRPHNEWN